ncbi:MAG: VWA domain-containing protein [Clostridiales bacterium]|nr:VWA domain-containing protein [Clostridiales bacterium]
MKIKGKVLSLLLAMSVSVAALVPANAVVAQGAAEQESTATLDCVNYTNVAPLSSVVPTVRKMNKLTDAKIGTDNPGIETSKTVTKNEDGTYTLRLESYVTGSTMTSVTQKPTDTVLVLDTSGSMKEYINVADKGSLNILDPQYASYYKWKVLGGAVWLDMQYQNDKWQYNIPILGWQDCDSTWLGDTVGIKKINAIKIAANDFIDLTSQMEGDNQIAIVTYASSSTIKNQLTPVPDGADALKNTINSLQENGATAADYGMQNAQKIIDDIPADRDSNKVVIMFTDGDPNHGSGFDASVANDTVSASKSMKNKGTTVYTIGVVEGADPTDYNLNINKYLHHVSSNYPNAESMTNGGTLNPNADPYNGGKSYYLSADNLQSLSDIFQSISDEIGGASVTLGTETVVKDVISDYFQLPAGADASKIAVKMADCYAFDGETPVWTNEKPVTLIPTIDADRKTIRVNGFDFSKNWVGKNTSSGEVHPGKKLIIEIPIERRDGFIGGNTVPTNGSDSGIYDKDGNLVENFEIPTTDVLIQYEYATEDQTIFLGETADLTRRFSLKEPYNLDGHKNQFVDIVYTLKTGGELVGTYTIPAGHATGTWTWEAGQSGTPALQKTTEYDVTCTVTPKNAGTCESLTLGDPDFTVHVKSGTLTITKVGGLASDKYVFNIEKDGEYYMTVTAFGNGSVTITQLPKGTYTITEETGWSWRWNPTFDKNVVEINKNTPDGSVICTNTQEKNQWLNGYDHKVNEKGGTR